jgi:hypothetical protein
LLYGVPAFQPQKFNLVWPEILKLWGGYLNHDTCSAPVLESLRMVLDSIHCRPTLLLTS